MKNFFAVLGGMGSIATESFVRRLNSKTVAERDQDYCNFVVFNDASVPDRTAYLLGESDANPVPYIVEDIKQVASLGPDFIVLTCNTAHAFFEDFKAASDVELLHMPYLAVKKICEEFPRAKRIGFLGTEGSLKSRVYEDAIEAEGLEFVVPEYELQVKVNYLIYHEVKERGILNEKLYHEIMSELKDVDVIILGCTELSAVEEDSREHPYTVIDAQEVLVDECLKRMKGN
ncbi:MAG: amino acid racemase [Lactobacillales bacterium]|jgi:aspartate racemase|nr:amino acid racemase [Lactobacillales bacterium]